MSWNLDPSAWTFVSELTQNGKRVILGARAFEILCTLGAVAGEPISKDELLKRIWPGAAVGENNLHVHISTLRQALGETSKAHLVTVADTVTVC